MINKPAEWEEVEAFTGDFEQIELGGHICKIINAKTEKSKSGSDMLVICFDIADGKNKDFYRRQFDRKNKNGDAKWQGIYRQLVDGNSVKFFKGIITSIEKSNGGYTWNWDESTLKGKIFGGVFGQEEYVNQQGEVKLATKLMFIRSVDAIKKGVEIPEVKKLNNASRFDSFGKKDATEEEIPF